MSVNSDIIKIYGLPGERYQDAFCELWHVQSDFAWLANVINTATGKPLERVLINSFFKSKLVKAFSSLHYAGVHTEIKTWDGCYNERSVRGSESTSLHAWAMAIDINADIEKLSQQKTHWSPCFIAIMKAAGLYWGGDFTTRKDNMHFALYNG